ncbi:MAG: ABC transporter ATP-binding protein [Eubacteriales bacterium]
MLKRLSKCIGEYKKNTILTPIFVSMEVVVECLLPFITASLIEQIEAGCELSVILKYVAVLVVLAMLSLSFGVLAGKHCAIASCGFAKNLRKDLYENTQNFSFENIDKFSTSSLVTRLTTDVTNVQQSFMMLIRTAIRCPFMLIFALIMSFVMGGKMALIFVAVVPFLIFALVMIIKTVMPIFERAFRKYDVLNNSVQENVKGMRVVKSFVREDYEEQKFDKASEDLAGDFLKAEKVLALSSPVMQLCMYAVTFCICYFGSKTILFGTNTDFGIGGLSGLITYGVQILSSLMMISMIFVTLTMSGESARRIYEVLEEKPTIKNPENAVTEVKNGDVDFDGVYFKYSERAEKYALENINLHIKSGQTVGIIGGTGSSKSTLIQLISRLYDATKGSVKVGDIDVRSYDLEALRNQVSVVLQKNILFSGTIKENLRWGDENASDEELVRACKLAQADEFISSLPNGYDTYIEQGGTNVSGGQKQRLCIARAILKKPKILILDDSTSAVDTKTDALIRNALRNEIPDTTKIIIAQRISSVENADMIVVLDDGKVCDVGTHAELLESSPIYREVYTSQTKGGKME